MRNIEIQLDCLFACPLSCTTSPAQSPSNVHTMAAAEQAAREKEGGRGERYFVLNVNICPMLREELEDRHMVILSGIVCIRPSLLHDGSQGKRNAVRG